jgi:hypothetical protein
LLRGFYNLGIPHLKPLKSVQKTTAVQDLFGHPIEKRVDKFERTLAKIDKETFTIRVERLKYLVEITGNFGMVGSIETVLILREAGWAYINGAFISTILLSQAFIERQLAEFMLKKGLESEAKHGAQEIIKYCRRHHLIDDFLLDKFDQLRKIRNPFVHVKPLDHPFTLGQRSFLERVPPNEVLENDAKDALSLMYTMLCSHLQ